MKKISFAVIISAICLFACRKDDPASDPPPPPPPPVEYVPIYNPCDTSMGSAHANKLTASWIAGARCRSIMNSGKKYWVLELTTCSNDGSLRELLAFTGISDNNPIQKYQIKNFTSYVAEGAVDPSYSTWSQDGDVLEDYYLPDTIMSDSYLQINSWNKITKQAEGAFSVAFNITEPRINSINPKKVKFTSGKFRVNLP